MQVEENQYNNRNFMQEQEQFDVVVVGAGIAGITAALTAAREGAKTALITDRPILGGSASSEIRVGPGGAEAGHWNRYARETGIVEEIFNHIHYRAQNVGKWRWIYFDQIYFDLVMNEKNLKCYLNTSVYNVETNEEHKITRVDGLQLRAEKIIKFNANVFIDCTGDGTIGYLAGADYRIGRESKEEFKEVFAPEKADKKTMGATLLFTSVNTGHPVKYDAPKWAINLKDIPSFRRVSRSIGKMPDGTFYGFWWVEYGGELDSIHDDAEIIMHLRQLVYGIWDYVKNSGDFTDVENHDINWVGYLPGKRESRRLMGPYIATSNDFKSQKTFEDTIGFTGWPIDIHPPKGYLSLEAGPGCTHDWLAGISDIPFRCIYSRNIPNLLFAGRHISCTHEGLGTLRLIPTTSVMGQAAGMAAKMCIEKGIIPNDIYNKHMNELQLRLARTDQSIIGYRLIEDNDLSRNSKVSVSSEASYELINPEHLKLLDKSYGLILPLKEKVEKISLYLKADTTETIFMDVYECDDKPQNYRVVNKIKTIEQQCFEEGWYDFKLNVEPGKGNKIIVMLRKNSNVWMYMAKEKMTGALGIFSEEDELLYDTKYMTINYSNYIPLTPCFILSPKQNIYKGDNINNGYTRPYGLPNLWMSGNMKPNQPEWVQLDFKNIEEIAKVEMVFNSELNHQRMHPSFKSVSNEMVKGYKLVALTPEGELTIVEDNENFKRFISHSFSKIKAIGIKLYIYSTWGGKRAEVFDLRVYQN